MSKISDTSRRFFGLLAITTGLSLLAWAIYNLLVEPLPEFEKHMWSSPLFIFASLILIFVGFDRLLRGSRPAEPGVSELCRLFLETTQKVLSNYPRLGYTLDVDESGKTSTLTIPRRDGTGFDIKAVATAREVTICAEGWHTHVDFFEDAENVVLYSLGLIRDLLSPHMRLRVLCSGGRPYRHIAESLYDGTWKKHSATGLVFWNYFGKKSESILQNKALYGRLDTPSEERLSRRTCAPRVHGK